MVKVTITVNYYSFDEYYLVCLGLAMRSATQEAASKSLGSITNSFSMQINRNTNPGTLEGLEILREKILKRLVRLKGLFRL